jgi:hypothetical protein
MVVAGIGLLAAGGLAALTLATPPPDQVAAGCWWWTARPVDQVAPGDHGCFRGYFVPGGGLADAAAAPVVILHMDMPSSSCPMRPGEAVVVAGEAVVSDGRITILVDRCR